MFVNDDGEWMMNISFLNKRYYNNSEINLNIWQTYHLIWSRTKDFVLLKLVLLTRVDHKKSKLDQIHWPELEIVSIA